MSKVNGLGVEEYQAWRHHPVTKMFLAYLSDFRTSLIEEMLRRWAAEKLQLSHEHEIRGRVEILDEMATLKFETIVEFYQKPEEANAAEVTQDGNS